MARYILGLKPNDDAEIIQIIYEGPNLPQEYEHEGIIYIPTGGSHHIGLQPLEHSYIPKESIT